MVFLGRVIFTSSSSLSPCSYILDYLLFSRLVLHSFPNSTCCFAGLKRKPRSLASLVSWPFFFRLILPCIYLLVVVVVVVFVSFFFFFILLFFFPILNKKKKPNGLQENEKRESISARERDKKVRKVKLILPFKFSYSAKLRYFLVVVYLLIFSTISLFLGPES